MLTTWSNRFVTHQTLLGRAAEGIAHLFQVNAVIQSPAEIAERMFRLPVDLRIKGYATLFQLVEATGYAGRAAEITLPVLRAAIRSRPGLIGVWIAYSTEKLFDWGWFLKVPDQGHYWVGPRILSAGASRMMADGEEACALFIKGEFEAIVGSAKLRRTQNQDFSVPAKTVRP